MSEYNKEYNELATKIHYILELQEGQKSIKRIIKLLSLVIPLLSVVSDGWDEYKDEELIKAITDWISKADLDIAILKKKLNDVLKEPDYLDLLNLLAELFGFKKAQDFLSQPNQAIKIILNDISIEELMVFKRKGMIELKPTGSIVSMGANNRIGNYFEELKRPYGFGKSFIVTYIQD